ncbi:MAG: hypothetical protein KAH03_02165 [Cocleimonas sp.]|nr:hypothetical protein [Cocleimonas sp.]
MKYLFFILLALLTACEPRERDTKNLPWKVSITESGATNVFDIAVGEVTLKELSIRLKKIADTALFQTPKGSLSIESYFGKTTIGLLEGRIIADLDANDEFLKAELNHAKDRDSTPNNNWKYQLSTEGAREIVSMRIWRLVYIPIAEYEEKQIKFFGKPKEIINVTKTAQYRLFPDKGIALLWDTDGGEIFYYVAPKDFPQLKASLPMEIVRPKED